MKQLLLLTALLIASTSTAVSQPGRNDHQEINLIDTLKAAGTFKTLLIALRQTGLNETLKGSGPFTIFAPNDEAFAKLPPGVLDSLMKDPAKLRALLLYHVTANRISLKDLQSRKDKSIRMMDDNDFGYTHSSSQRMLVDTVFGSSTGGQKDDRLRDAGPSPQDKTSPIIINGSAKLVVADLDASNGTVHVVDSVLWPKKPSSRLLKKSSATLGSRISLCNLCGSLCLSGETAPKTFTTEAQRPPRSHGEDSLNFARGLFQQPARSLNGCIAA